MHISETSINILNSLILLYMLAERTVTQLHVGHLILILNEKLVTVLTHVNWQVRSDILKVPLGVGGVEVTVVKDVDFFETNGFQHGFIDLNGSFFD